MLTEIDEQKTRLEENEVLIHHENLTLLPEKVVFWKERKTLIAADLHFGKATHFRKHGLNVNDQVFQTDLAQLDRIVKKTGAERLIILGDLFHATENREWTIFAEWLRKSGIELELVLGNHDVLSLELYASARIIVHKEIKTESCFVFKHDADDQNNVPEGMYVLSGHIHPSVILRGKALQSVRAECFAFGEKIGLLPAFGSFKGNSVIRPGKKDRVFIVVADKILRIS